MKHFDRTVLLLIVSGTNVIVQYARHPERFISVDLCSDGINRFTNSYLVANVRFSSAERQLKNFEFVTLENLFLSSFSKGINVLLKYKKRASYHFGKTNNR